MGPGSHLLPTAAATQWAPCERAGAGSASRPTPGSELRCVGRLPWLGSMEPNRLLDPPWATAVLALCPSPLQFLALYSLGVVAGGKGDGRVCLD